MFEQIERAKRSPSLRRSAAMAAYVADALVGMRTLPRIFDAMSADELRQIADQAARLHVAADLAHQVKKAAP